MNILKLIKAAEPFGIGTKPDRLMVNYNFEIALNGDQTLEAYHSDGLKLEQTWEIPQNQRKRVKAYFLMMIQDFTKVN